MFNYSTGWTMVVLKTTSRVPERCHPSNNYNVDIGTLSPVGNLNPYRAPSADCRIEIMPIQRKLPLRAQLFSERISHPSGVKAFLYANARQTFIFSPKMCIFNVCIPTVARRFQVNPQVIWVFRIRVSLLPRSLPSSCYPRGFLVRPLSLSHEFTKK